MLQPNTVQAQSTDLTRVYIDGIRAYETENYAKAVDEFKTLVDSGIVNAKLFYNLANAYLRNNQLGHAVLWYEKAQRLAPNDPDLRFNLNYAQSLVKDAAENTTPAIFKVLLFWYYALSAKTIKAAAICCNLIFWILLGIGLINKKWLIKPAAYTFFVLSLILATTVAIDYYNSAVNRIAIILPEKVIVRSGLSDDATRLFELHAGTQVGVEKEQNGFYRIFFAEGKIGWIEKSDAGII